RSAKGPKHAASTGASKIIPPALLAVLLVVAGGFFGYTFFFSKPAPALPDNAEQASRQNPAHAERPEFVPEKIESQDLVVHPAEAEPDIPAEPAKDIQAKPAAVVSPEIVETPKPDVPMPLPVEKKQPVAIEQPPVMQEQVQTPEPKAEQKDNSYAINAGSFPSKSTAEKELAKLKAGGFEAYIEEIALAKKGVWYRVKIGRFASRTQAESAQKELLKRYKLRSFIYSRSE
ncbi:MAG: SPOR domain-containing protein, partial [Pseudomonadota bacterium]